jgi:hypothetical protein
MITRAEKLAKRIENDRRREEGRRRAREVLESPFLEAWRKEVNGTLAVLQRQWSTYLYSGFARPKSELRALRRRQRRARPWPVAKNQRAAVSR